jgi:2-iminobutanoate/2-iminopropanoate deaminase
MKPIQTPNAPQPGGHYAQAIVHNGLVYISGQLPIDPQTRERSRGGMQVQTELVLSNLAAILQAAGSSPDRVIQTTIYISDINLWDRVNEVYGRFFGDHRPARTIIPTRELHFGALIELDAIAAVAE